MIYCSKCGSGNNEQANFCKVCGKAITKVNEDNNVEVSKIGKTVEQHQPPYPYSVSIKKFIVLSITTLGLYEIYWFYKQFKSFKSEANWQITPIIRAIFAPLTSYTLFKKINEVAGGVDKNIKIEAPILAAGYFIINILWRLPDPYWLVSLFAFVVLIPVQDAINKYWEVKYGDKIVKSKFGGWNYIFSIIGSIVLLLALWGTFFPEDYY